MVICNQAEWCLFNQEEIERGFGCGGAIPHEPCSECNKCTCDKHAKCVEVNDGTN